MTGSTFLHYPYFKEDAQKQIILNQFKSLKQKFNIPIISCSIAINHYHLMFYLEQGIKLIKIKQLIHGGGSFYYRKSWPVRVKNIWGSSKILVLTSDCSYWQAMGYVIGNLLKHQEATTFQELKNNPFSSYSFAVAKYGGKFCENLVHQVITVPEDAQGFIDLGALKDTKVSPPSAKAG